MIYIALLKRFWPLIAFAGLLIAGWLWHSGQIRKARADERQKVTLAYQQALQDVITRREERVAEVRERYEAKIDSLSKSVAIELRGPAIRLCPSAVSVSAPQDPGGLAGSASDEHALRTDVDIRPAAVRVGETCEKLRQQLIAIRALQQ